MKKSRASTVILIIVFLVGLSLLLYPSLSDYWNSFRQSRAIASYVESVSHLDNQEYQALLEEARAYNASLVGDKTRFSPTEEELAEYLTLLGSTGAAVGYVEIPAIKLTLPIYLGTSETVLQVGVGTMEGSSLPIGGESTHAVLTGHRGLPSATLFTDLDRLVQGDMFHIHILNETCTYEVDQILIVEPAEMDALEIVEGEDYCTLVTCTPYGVNSHRMLVRGHRIETPEDAVFVQVSPDALQMDPLFIAPFVAVPILLVLLLFLLFGGQKRSAKSNSHQKAQAKKGGNSGDDDQKVDR
ncbi:MAG TPA: class C sortase [Candidatus Intestinimonas stercorigallinarum]|nr:class C sortase [Candidatus Intestinimonas stercorigallinarum]